MQAKNTLPELSSSGTAEPPVIQTAQFQGNHHQILLELTPTISNQPQTSLSPPPFSVQPNDEYHPIYHPTNNDDMPPQNKYQIGEPKKQPSSCLRTLKAQYHRYWTLKKPAMKKYFPCILPIFFLILAGILAGLAVYYFRDKKVSFPSVAGALSYIAWNLKADPILDIQAAASCPAGYESMLLGIWPGTIDGCSCPDRLKAGKCRSASARSAGDVGCTNIPAISRLNMFEWDDLTWCVLKAKGYKKAVECSEGFRKCSSGICILESLDCPITKVGIVGGNIETEKVEGESPVIDLAITPNDIPCFGADYFASGPVAPYVLINENEKGCLKYGLDDQYSFKIDVKKQKELFEENDFPDRVMNLVGYKSVYEKTDSVLSYRKRLNLAEKDFCLDIDTEVLEKSSEAAKELDSFFGDFVIGVSIIHVIAMIFVLLLFGVSRKRGNPWFATFSELRKTDKIAAFIFCYTLFAALEYIGVVVLFALTTHSWIKTNGTRTYLRALDSEGCFLDWKAKTAIRDYQEVNSVTENVFGFCVAMFLLWTFFLPILFYLPFKAVKKGSS